MLKRKRLQESLWNSEVTEIPGAFHETMSNLRYVFEEGKPETFSCFNRIAKGYRTGDDNHEIEILQDGDEYLISLDYEKDVTRYILSREGMLKAIDAAHDRSTMALYFIQNAAIDLMNQVSIDIDRRDERNRYLKIGVVGTAAVGLLYGSIIFANNSLDGIDDRHRESYDRSNSSLPASTFSDGSITIGYVPKNELDDIPEHIMGESLVHPRRYEISRDDLISGVCGVIDVSPDDAANLRIASDGNKVIAGDAARITTVSDEQLQLCLPSKDWTWDGETDIAVQVINKD